MLGEKVVLMVAVWACFHQALRNRVDRFWCRKKKKEVPLVMNAAASFSKLSLLLYHTEEAKTRFTDFAALYESI